jgi:hypothetical protein
MIPGVNVIMWITLPSLRIFFTGYIVVHSIVDAFTRILPSSSPARPLLKTATYLQRHAKAPPSPPPTPTRIVLLGGTGRIGTAVTIHLLQWDATCEVVLMGRRRPRPKALKEMIQESASSQSSSTSSSSTRQRVSFQSICSVWEASPKLEALVKEADCLIHVAGPYLNRNPSPRKWRFNRPPMQGLCRCLGSTSLLGNLPINFLPIVFFSFFQARKFWRHVVQSRLLCRNIGGRSCMVQTSLSVCPMRTLEWKTGE